METAVIDYQDQFSKRKKVRVLIKPSNMEAIKFSQTFIHADYKDYIWYLMIHKNVDDNLFGIYLLVANARLLPRYWSIDSRFSISVINKPYPHLTVFKEGCYRFYEHKSCCGWPSFMPLDEIYDPVKRFLEDDTLTILIDFTLRYDPREETGYVGLKNHSVNSCMTSVLQTLYNIPHIRKAVHQMPIMEGDTLSTSIPLNVQRLFYELQSSSNSVATKDLIEHLRYDAYDAHEMSTILCNNLKEKMKGTVLEGTIPKLFEGHQLDGITCVNVEHRSVRKQSFYDLQLDVKGCPDVYASFDKYVSVEHLEGDNKYQTEEYGLQDARKGSLFLDFPPVLQLQLKRWEYDSVKGTKVKINDRYEFPLELDLDRENGKYLSIFADRRVRNLYTLYSVLAHRREEYVGRYHVFIRPTLSEQWLNFEDEKVTTVDTKRAVEEQYGGDEELIKTEFVYHFPNQGLIKTDYRFNSELYIANTSNAYMLVYIRKSDVGTLFWKVNDVSIHEQLLVRFKKEQGEKTQNINEAIYTLIKVAGKEDLTEQIGKNVYFDLVNHDKVRFYYMEKWMPFYILKEKLERDFGIPVRSQRIWLWEKRENKTYRPLRSLTQEEETLSVRMLMTGNGNSSQDSELNLFLDEEPPFMTSERHVLIFFKLYEPVQEQISYIGSIWVSSDRSPLSYLSRIKEMADLSLNQSIALDFYKEIRFTPNVICEPIDVMQTFHDNMLVNGDIICITINPVRGQQCRYPTIASYFEYVRNRQVIRFRPIESGNDEFLLDISKFDTYDDIVRKVASELDIYDPSTIRLRPHDSASNKPKITPIKSGNVSLIDILRDGKRATDILCYEVEEVSTSETDLWCAV